MTAPLENHLLQTFSAIASLITPLILAIIGGMGWLMKTKIEKSQAAHDAQIARIRELEDRLREDRILTYNALLEPFFLIFTTDAAFATDQKYKNKQKNEIAVNKMLSVEYRQVGFRLSLVANDEVIRAYNKLMQFFYHTEDDSRNLEEKTSHWISLMGALFLEIRKSMGNETSNLDRWEMIEWFMKDAALLKRMHQMAPNPTVHSKSVE